MDAKLDFNAFHRVFLIFTMLNLCFSENNTRREVKNKKVLSEQEVKSKREIHHQLSIFLVWEVLLTVIQTGRLKLPNELGKSFQNRKEQLPVWCT